MRKRERILSFLAEFGKISARLLFPRSLSFGKYKIARAIRDLLDTDDDFKDENVTYRRKKVLCTVLYRLRKEGLVAKSREKEGVVWKLTQKGWKIIKQYREIKLPVNGKTRLFIFDIPESERKRRDWLRDQLKLRGYQPLQKSVWWSNRPLAEAFIQELDDLNLTKYIHIFGLGDKGTLKELKLSE